jgi:hypothetical protein
MKLINNYTTGSTHRSRITITSLVDGSLHRSNLRHRIAKRAFDDTHYRLTVQTSRRTDLAFFSLASASSRVCIALELHLRASVPIRHVVIEAFVVIPKSKDTSHMGQASGAPSDTTE